MKINKQTKSRKGFTLVELLVVIAIIAILAGLSTPAITRALKRAALTASINDARQIKILLEELSIDFDGQYLNSVNALTLGGAAFANGAGAFTNLFTGGILDEGSEKLFYTKEMRTAVPTTTEPNNDGVLSVNECCYSYMSNLSNTSPGTAPVIMTKVASTTDFYSSPWDHKAVIVRVDNSAAAKRLTGAFDAANLTATGQVEEVRGAGLKNVIELGTDAGGVLCQ